ncbi:MAG: CAP domain-containing protein [Pseudomonadota bacterium]
MSLAPLAWLVALAGCGLAPLHRTAPGEAVHGPEVRYRFGEPQDEAGRWLLAEIPGARWDPGLLAAARELAAAASEPSARLVPDATLLAQARAGFPGDARFSRLYTGGALPEALIAEARAVKGAAAGLDVALASRRYGDGTVLWVLGAAPHWMEIDPIPRDLSLDDPLPLQVGADDGASFELFVAPPDGAVVTIHLGAGLTRYVDLFHVPGRYDLEVVDLGPDYARVVLTFSVFVEAPPPPMGRLPSGLEPQDPMAATAWLYRALNERRRGAGLAPVAPFPGFEPLAREHAAFMASSGVLGHTIPGLTDGVAARAWEQFHPRARHYEDLAAAFTAEEALDLAWGSPGHRRNLLCEDCTHAAIGVALEPTAGGPARLFVTWELLAFPEGAPRALDRH